MTQSAKMINITPTWEQIAPALAMILSNKPMDRAAMDELLRMARLADQYVKSQEKKS